MKRLTYIIVAFFVISVAAISGEDTESGFYSILLTQDDAELGEIKIILFPEIAPQHCRNFDSLVAAGFYDGLAFHRIIPGVLIQGGDPNTRDKPKEMWGTGDPSQRRIHAEFNNTSHTRGIISAARTPDPDSHTSQFFICLTELSQLDHQYTVFGKVVEGIEIIEQVSNSPRNDREAPLKDVIMRIWKHD